MRDAERYWAIAAGALGLACLVAGAVLARLPPVDCSLAEVRAGLADRRTPVLAGAVLTVAGGALLIWPVAAVVTFGDAVWPSLALVSGGLAVLGAAVFLVVGLCVATAVWRPDRDATASRSLLDLAHLGTWAISAPIGALLVVATTVAGVQADLFGPLVVAVAAVKAATVVVEVAGVGRTEGWNAGGWGAGTSGYVTVLWYGLMIAALA